MAKNTSDNKTNRLTGVKKNAGYLGRGIIKLSRHFMFIVMVILFVVTFICIRLERNGYIPEYVMLIALAALLVIVAVFYLWCRKKRDDDGD